MKLFNKNMMVVGAMALTLTLFSFKSTESNEVNMGETVMHQQTVTYDYADGQEAARIVKALKALGKGAKESFGQIW